MELISEPDPKGYKALTNSTAEPYIPTENSDIKTCFDYVTSVVSSTKPENFTISADFEYKDPEIYTLAD